MYIEEKCYILRLNSCPLRISQSDASIVPRCCRFGQCEWSPDTEPGVGDSSGGHREVIGQYQTCLILPDWFGRSGGFSQRNDAWQPISTDHIDYVYFAGCFKSVGYLKMCHLPRGPAFIFMFSCSL